MSRAVLFDLDGTLADTAPDLGGALNRVLHAHGRPEQALEVLRPYTSQGVRGLLRAGFGITPDDPSYADLANEVLAEYTAGICNETRLFDGMPELLDQLEQDGVTWGIMTNKHQRFTTPLMQALKLDRRAACIVCGDSTPHPKPAPDGLLLAARLIDRSAMDCLYVGDDKRDMDAAHAAQMIPIAAAWGYLGVDHPIDSWGARHILSHPAQVMDYLGAPGL
ncbi:MAG: HAD-IA family hydrolase [Rhodocyclaceae bacterium]